MSYLTPNQAELLLEVYRHPDRGPAEHARAMGKDPGRINKLTLKLEELALAERWTPTRRPPGSRTLRPIRPLPKALLLRQGHAVVFCDDGRRQAFFVLPDWTAQQLADAPLFRGQPVVVLYRDQLAAGRLD